MEVIQGELAKCEEHFGSHSLDQYLVENVNLLQTYYWGKGNSLKKWLLMMNIKSEQIMEEYLPFPSMEKFEIVRRRMIWNIRGDFGAEVIGSSGLGYAAWRWWFKRRFWMVLCLMRLLSARMVSPRPK